VLGTAAYSCYHITVYRREKKEGENEIDATRQNFRFTFFLWCIILYIAAISFASRIQYINHILVKRERSDAFGPVQADIMMMYDNDHGMHAATSPLAIGLSHSIQGSLARLAK